MNKTIKILIVEDEVLIANYIKDILEEHGFLNIKIANDAKEGSFLMANFIPEIILMDINLNGVNSGIELSKNKNANAQIIFLTGQHDMDLMSKAIATNPISYLTKPIKKNDLIAAIVLILQKNTTEKYKFKNGFETLVINLNEILYIKSDNNYIDIFLEEKKYTSRKTLDAFLKEVDNPNFIRIHKSYIINKSKITKTTNNFFFINTIKIPKSRTFNLEV